MCQKRRYSFRCLFPLRKAVKPKRLEVKDWNIFMCQSLFFFHWSNSPLHLNPLSKTCMILNVFVMVVVSVADMYQMMIRLSLCDYQYVHIYHRIWNKYGKNVISSFLRYWCWIGFDFVFHPIEANNNWFWIKSQRAAVLFVFRNQMTDLRIAPSALPGWK